MLAAAAAIVAVAGFVFIVLPILWGTGKSDSTVGGNGQLSTQESASDGSTASTLPSFVDDIPSPANNNTTVVVLGLDRRRGDEISRKLKKLSLSRGFRSKFKNQYVSVELIAVTEVAALVPLIDFGAVIHVDADRRMIYVDAQKAPNQPKVATNTGTAPATTPTSSLQGKTVAGIPLVVHAEFNNRVQFLRPEQFSVMSDQLRRTKYPAKGAPQIVFTNEATSVNVALNHTEDKVRIRELPRFARQMQSALKPSATEWLGTQQRTIAGRQWVTFEFRSAAIDTQIRNLLACTSLDNRLLLLSFNTTVQEEPEWWPVGAAIIDSLRVNSK